MLPGVTLLLIAALVRSGPATAESGYDDWTWRAAAGIAGRFVEDDNVTFDDPTFGTSSLEQKGNPFGITFGVERRLSKLIGLDLTLGYTDMDIDFMHTVGTGVQKDSLASLNLWFAVNFHVVNTEKFDFWVAPQIAYVNWMDDLTFDVPGTGTFNLNTDNEFPAIGLALGADWWVSRDWAVNFAFKFIDADADSGHILPIDQTFVTVGVARKF